MNKEAYPFGRRKYEIPAANNKKKALSLADIGLIYNYPPEPGTTAEMAKDYFVFMYLCNGINIKDVSLLKFKNIKGDFIEFQRAKTARTKRTAEAIRVPLTDEIKAIVVKHGNSDQSPDNYIFSILTHGISAQREYQLIQQLTGVVNDHLKVIAEKLNIAGNLTSYSARHSFATILKRSGISTEFISEALGHSNVKTTQSYLASFEDESRLEAVKKLTAFK